MAIVILTKDNFDNTINTHDMVLVDFGAEWCGPCRAFEKIYEAASEKHADIVFARVDIEEETELAEDFQVRSIPRLMVFRRNIAVFAESGALTQTALEKIIQEAKALDLTEVRKVVEDQDSKK